MRPETLALLIAADHPVEWEAPPDFDWHNAMTRVRNLQPKVESLLECRVKIDENVQDASFFTQILCDSCSIMFSAFGNLFTIWTENGLLGNLEEKVVPIVENEAFVYVPTYELDEIYTGINEAIKSGDPRRRCSWNYR
ncbi:MAG TPA: hypothetical protein VF627_14760, partial [Abditibacterium sp.]